ncbi:AraC family transcriptional regulator [Parasedimentitalea maritima]|uniref:AraC family transcriptional regulator n=1 Tax=Parasedimentitalea maritima TaxID=2578117 RepID=A0ABY2V1K2_9RHOB|nr:AraC family transcriptional regulator [Zongyanglinia marina]TLP67339.1 AraC family transcriptional regulator [Zongyanglinia marina]
MTGKAQMHTAALAQALAGDLIENGYDIDAIMRRCSFDASILEAQSPVVKFSDSLRFFELAAKLTKNDIMGLQMGMTHDIRHLGLVCYVGLASPNLAGFLANYGRYVKVINGLLNVDVSQLYDKGAFYWSYEVSPTLTRRQYVETTCASFLHTLRKNTHESLTPRLVRFHHNRSRHLEAFDAYFGGRVEFGAETDGIEFELSDLEIPLKTADRTLLKVLMSYADKVLEDMGQQMPDLIVEVERAIADQLATGAATLNNVAASIGMSPRTLSRKLAAEGTTFFQLLEELRKSLSKSYLRDSDLGLAEISFLMGYSGLSSFNDAFKRWTGNSPGQFRAT